MPRTERNFQKFRDEPDEKKNEIPTLKKRIHKRIPKPACYNDCKSDLKHLLFISNKVQRDVRHSLLPNMTLENCPVECFEDLSRYTNPYYTLTEPCPAYIARKHCQRVDPCFQRTLARAFYRNNLSKIFTTYNNTLKQCRKFRKLEKNDTYSPLVYAFAEKLELHPDPFFYGNYDYYYTGGNLCMGISNDEQIVMHVDDLNSNTIRASKIPSEVGDLRSVGCLEEIATQKLPSAGDIFQILPLIDVSNRRQNMIGARQRNSICLMKVRPENNDIKVVTEFKTASTPFISFAQSAENPEMFVLTTMKENIRTYDISRKDVSITNRSNNRNEKEIINWNTIHHWQNQSFLYANEREISVMDFRTPKENWINVCCEFSSEDYACELISCLAKSQFNNLFYVGSSHKLRCLDTRFFGRKNFFEDICVCEWTHQLNYPPLLIDIFHTHKRECISIASPIAGDQRLLEMTRARNADCLTESVYKSYCMPWQPPTLQEAYGSACLDGKALQPEADLKERIRSCTTGLAFCKPYMKNDNKTTMIWANSNGDIYAQTLRKRTDDMDVIQRTSNESNEIIGQYASKVSELAQPDLNYTEVLDFKVMRKVFLCNSLSGNSDKIEEEKTQDKKPDEKELKFRRNFRGGWQKSMYALKSYKDALVQDILSIWDIPVEDGIDVKYSELKKKFEKKEEDKEHHVLNWLNSGEAVAPTIKIPIANLNSSNMEVQDNIFQTSANLDLSNVTQMNASDFDMDQSLQETLSTLKKPKVAKKKKKHVKGF